MKFSSIIVALLLTSSSVAAFAPHSNQAKLNSAIKSSTVSPDPSKPLFDPLGLYSKDSQERKQGLIKPLEFESTPYNTIKDPLNIYDDKSYIDNKPMSASVPFLEQPPMLDGSLPGDRGFDPFNFSSNSDALQWYRTAEIKHARLAMLSTVGWIFAELFDKPLANAFNLQPLLSVQDRVPSVLNGGLDRISLGYWVVVLGFASAIETIGTQKEKNAATADIEYIPGDLGFDPLGLSGKSEEEQYYKKEAELFNGRLSMLAITGFALQEWWTQQAVINQTPIFFKPINIVLQQLQDAAGNGL